MKKLLNIIAWSTIVISIGMIITIGTWLLCPYNLMTVNEKPMPVLTKEVEGGDYLIYKLNFCKNTDKTPSVDYAFYDGLIYPVPANTGIFKPKGCYELLVQVYIPKTLPKGEYRIQTNHTYQVNPIRKVTYSYKTESFLVK